MHNDSKDGLFSGNVAQRYDAAHASMYKPEVIEPTVAALKALGNGGKVLEFAIGTGRVALPLQAAGVEVHGIELSRAMVAQMRDKAGGATLPVTMGSMTDINLGQQFSLVYLVYNTITNLLTQDEQVECFINGARHLQPSGKFLIEVGVPTVASAINQTANHSANSTTLSVFDLSPEHVGIDEYDAVNQILVSHHIWFDGDNTERFDSAHRYAWPAEYDLMARIAGLKLAHRWGDWDGAPFTSDSPKHISVWQKV